MQVVYYGALFFGQQNPVHFMRIWIINLDMTKEQASSKILRLPIPKKHLTGLDQEKTLDNKFKVTSDSKRPG